MRESSLLALEPKMVIIDEISLALPKKLLPLLVVLETMFREDFLL